jgi:hypothetical protein
MSLSPVWFEKYGDTRSDHCESAEFYLDGIGQSPKYFNNWVKYTGALILASQNPDELLVALLKSNGVAAIDLSEWIFAGLRYEMPSTKTVAGTRWSAGRSFLQPWLKDASN